MKLLSSRPRDFLFSCVFVTVANFLLFQLMASTHMIEKVMALNLQWWELFLIVLFLGFRLGAYLIVGPALLALVIYAVAKRFLPTDNA